MKVARDDTGLPSVVADIGATNIRFARLTPQGNPGPIVKFATSKFPDLKAALVHFLKLEGGPRPVRLGLGIAGLVPVDQGWRPIATEGGHTAHDF